MIRLWLLAAAYGGYRMLGYYLEASEWLHETGAINKHLNQRKTDTYNPATELPVHVITKDGMVTLIMPLSYMKLRGRAQLFAATHFLGKSAIELRYSKSTHHKPQVPTDSVTYIRNNLVAAGVTFPSIDEE